MAFIVIAGLKKGHGLMMDLIGRAQEEDTHMKNEFLCMIGYGAGCPHMIGWRPGSLHMKGWGVGQCYVTQWEEESLHGIGWSKWPVIECLMIS